MKFSGVEFYKGEILGITVVSTNSVLVDLYSLFLYFRQNVATDLYGSYDKKVQDSLYAGIALKYLYLKNF